MNFWKKIVDPKKNFLKCGLQYNFLTIYRKIWFHLNGVNNYFIILCIFPNISFWRQSIFFIIFLNPKSIRFKKILGIKLSDKSIVSKKDERETKESLRLYFRKARVVCLHNFQLLSSFQMVEMNKYWHSIFRSSRPKVFSKKGVLRYYAKFTGKHLCQSLFFNKVAGLRSKACKFI